MKKAYSSLLILLILLQSQAFAGTSSLKNILDEYSYAVEVEWDQNNQEQLSLINSQLNNSLNDYLESHSGEELVSELIAGIQDPAIQQEVLMALKNAQDGAALKASLQTIYSKSQQQGAQWSAVGKVALGAVGVLALTYIAFRIYMYEWGKRL